MDKFAALEAFIAVVETGSFQSAGERLGIAKSVISRRISLLEENLGTRLLHRTTRKQSLTDTGNQFYQRSVQILADLDEAELETAEENSNLRGKIRLAAPLSFGLNHLSGAISRFMSEYPAIELDLDLNDRPVNLIEDGFDMAVRIGELEDSTLIAKRIGLSRNLTCASDDYLAKHGIPTSISDLSDHIGLQYSHLNYKNQWQFKDRAGKLAQGKPQIRIRANNGEALAAAAAAGLGICSAPSFILADYIKTGKLVTILSQYHRPTAGIYTLLPPGRLIPRRIQAFSAYLASYFGDIPYWDKAIDDNKKLN